MQTAIASLLGRPDTAMSYGGADPSIPLDRWNGTSGGIQGIAGQLGVTLSRTVGTLEGRIQGGMIIVAIAAIAGFYLWTRNIQA